jgi:Cu/Ag efflux protein CusF
MKNFKSLLTLAVLLAASTASFAASHAGAPMTMPMPDTKKEMPAAGGASGGATAMTEGEIRKVDMDNKKLTIKHGDIKNLDMPGMTMVFQVKDPAMLDKVKAGDKVRFKAEKSGGAIVVTDIQPAK